MSHRSVDRRLLASAALIVLGMVVALLPVVARPAFAAPPSPRVAAAPAAGALRVSAVDAGPGKAVIPLFKWLVTRDDTGTYDLNDPKCRQATNPQYPVGCTWPSITATPGGTAAQMVTQGDQTDFAGGTAVSLPGGDYLVSVTAAGHKIDGAHVHVDGATKDVLVTLNSTPLLTATLRSRVFDDKASTNGELDEPAETVVSTCTGPQGGQTCTPSENMSGFRAQINDISGQVTNDVFANPLCTIYQAATATGGPATNGGNPVPADQHKATPDKVFIDSAGRPVVVTVGGGCSSDQLGDVVIPNLGPNRYAFQALKPAGSDWVQTSTLEGGHDWDTWVAEGNTGFDTEKVGPGGELVPATTMGFVHSGAAPTYRPFTGTATGAITGVAAAVKAYVPSKGGITQAGLAGMKIDHVIDRPWVAVDDLNNGDQQVAVTRGGTDGRYSFANVPDGDYSVAVWDDDQNALLQIEQVSVRGGVVADMGTVRLAEWFTTITGTVFNDTNGDGVQQPGEAGIPNFVVALKVRDNSLEDQGQQRATTDSQGHYSFTQAYPLNYWLVLEAYNQRYKTTGYTSQADNQPTATTHTGSGVDVNVMNVISLSQRVDWGVQRYTPGTNGGIVGTVSYDTTRNETDARKSIVEAYQGGMPGIPVHLHQPVACTPATYTATDGSTCVAHEGNLGYVSDPNGAVRTGPELGTYTSETWARPVGCVSRGVDGTPVSLPFQPTPTSPDQSCIESPSIGAQAGGTPTDPFATVNGNYSFTERWRLDTTGAYVACDATYTATDRSHCDTTSTPGRVLEPMAPGAYIIKTEIPNDSRGKPLFQVTKEEDVNVFTGDTYVPNIPEPECAGALHTVNVTTNPADDTVLWNHKGVYNPDFLATGGSPFQGQARPLCDAKLVPVNNGVSVAPNFTFFTSVPLPGRFHTLVIDDLNLSHDPRDTTYGEKLGVKNMPVGIYDSTGRLDFTGVTDANGILDVQMPSTSTYSCPLPAGPCPNVYRFVANDPGQPGAPNPTFNPNYRSTATEFTLWPNETLPADLAPTTIGTTVTTPGTATLTPVTCVRSADTPVLTDVDKPVITPASSPDSRTVVLHGHGFGTTGTLLVDGTPATPAVAAVSSWTATSVTVVLAPNVTGEHALTLRSPGGQTATPGITIRALGGGYRPQVFNVGPGQTYATVQAGVDAAQGSSVHQVPPPVVLVHPGVATSFNPRGGYQENVIVSKPIVIQGYGPGDPSSAHPTGTVLDGSGFASTDVRAAWRTKLATLTWDGNQTAYEGAVVSYFGLNRDFNVAVAAYRPGLAGMTITGGDPQDFPGTVKGAGANPTVAVAQGGGVYLNGRTHHVGITDVTFDGNAGAYGGAIRSGTPFSGSAENTDLAITGNRIVHSGGSALAGAVGLFTGTTGYQISGNDFCGNFSAEYGGAVSSYGNNGAAVVNRIDHNRIWDNSSYDEGAGIMIAGELPRTANQVSAGAGAVDVFDNIVHENIAGDDGGGIRLLQAGLDPIRIFNNQVTDNVSAHEGGGIAIDDATNVGVFDNTIAKNVTTSTASTSNGQPAPAGLSTAQLSVQLQAAYTARFHRPAPAFANPALYGNLFNDNRAGTFNTATGTVVGISDTDANVYDLGIADGLVGQKMTLVASLLTSATSNTSTVTFGPDTVITTTPMFDPTGSDPAFAPTVQIEPFLGNPNFVSAVIVVLGTGTDLHGNYHLKKSSPAVDAGTTAGLNAAKGGLSGPPAAAARADIDGTMRGGQPGASPTVGSRPDIGAVEVIR